MNLRMGVFVLAVLLSGTALTPLAQGQGPGRGPSKPAHQVKYDVDIQGVSAVQLSWWFQHIGDKDGQHWKALSPDNQKIHWAVDPADDAHQLIGALFESDQKIAGAGFPGDTFHTQAQFEDYITQSRSAIPGQPAPLSPTIPVPRDYMPPHPSPVNAPLFGPGGTPVAAADNGFNEDLLLFDGKGFCPLRMLFSWVNTGDDDTPATQGKPRSVSLTLTFYLPWMEGGNRPPALSQDGYYYTDDQLKAIWSLWEQNLKALPAHLPDWFNKGTQDDIARTKGFTVTSIIDTGTTPGLTSKMEVWWWNHGMGDAPGNAYVFWCPPAHHTIRWLPGYSPSEVLKGGKVPEDHIVPGIIYPDLQGDNLEQTGGGMMAYPPSMSPIPGAYQIVDPMRVVSKAEVDNFDKDRFPVPTNWLIHQWGDTPGGLIHRSTGVAKLPLRSPVTQAQLISDHQDMEGLFLSTGKLAKLYADWKKTQH